MTRALRARHRRAAVALGVVLPAGIALALAARPAPPPVAPLGIAALDAPGPPVPDPPRGSDGDRVLAIATRLAADDTGVTLDLVVRSDVGQPGTLVYWSAGEGRAPGDDTTIRPDATDVLPGDAILLGPVDFQRAERFALPPAARDASGALLFYRIAQGSVVATVPLAAPGALPPRGASS